MILASSWRVGESRTIKGHFASCDGNPTDAVDFIMAAGVVFASSNLTSSSFLAYMTFTAVTPCCFSNVFLMVTGHAGQVIPGTLNVIDLGAAHAEPVNTSPDATTANASFIEHPFNIIYFSQ